MERDEKLALFLGMLCGDGCLPIRINNNGYRDYSVQFYNTDKDIVILFDNLFFDIFKVRGKIRYSDRIGKKRLWEFQKYSKKIVEKLKKMGFPEGIKRDSLRIIRKIKDGSKKEKMAFIYGFLITDGSIKKHRDILFHSGSKVFLEELSELISEFTGKDHLIKEYIQRERFKSYQLYLNKTDTTILGILDINKPTWDNRHKIKNSKTLQQYL